MDVLNLLCCAESTKPTSSSSSSSSKLALFNDRDVDFLHPTQEMIAEAATHGLDLTDERCDFNIFDVHALLTSLTLLSWWALLCRVQQLMYEMNVARLADSQTIDASATSGADSKVSLSRMCAYL